MTRDDLLDELAFLATVEHALLVEYLSLYAAFGQDVDSAVTGASSRVQFAANEAETLTRAEMTRLHNVNAELVAAGRPAELGRAASIRGAGGVEISLRPPSKTELERLLDREREIAFAVDERYRKLRAVIDGELADSFGGLLELLSNHADSLAPLTQRLADAPPTEYLRVSRREPQSELERRLLVLSDQVYAAILAMVDVWFTHDDQLGGQLRSPAISAMTALNGVNAELVKRGLLPAYSL